MSNGYWTDERHLMQETARDFTTKEVLPVANELDPEKGVIPRELIDKMGEMGYFGITIPEEKGGLGLGCFEYCLIAEELAEYRIFEQGMRLFFDRLGRVYRGDRSGR